MDERLGFEEFTNWIEQQVALHGEGIKVLPRGTVDDPPAEGVLRFETTNGTLCRIQLMNYYLIYRRDGDLNDVIGMLLRNMQMLEWMNPDTPEEAFDRARLSLIPANTVHIETFLTRTTGMEFVEVLAMDGPDFVMMMSQDMVGSLQLDLEELWKRAEQNTAKSSVMVDTIRIGPRSQYRLTSLMGEYAGAKTWMQAKSAPFSLCAVTGRDLGLLFIPTEHTMPNREAVIGIGTAMTELQHIAQSSGTVDHPLSSRVYWLEHGTVVGVFDGMVEAP